MKNILHAAGILFCVFFMASGVSALETGVTFHLGNLEFESDRVPGTLDFDGTTFPWGLNAYAVSSLSEDMSMEAGFDTDPVLHNTVYARLLISREFFSLGVGPFFGVFNSLSTIMKSGISTSARIEFPGIAYLTFRSDNTIGGQLVAAGDYSQELNAISLGYYVRNAICSVNLETRRFTTHTDNGDITDLFTEYSFRTNLFKKNVPYTALVSLAYQQLDKSFLEQKIYHTVGSLVIGTQLQTKIGSAVETFIHLESSIYTFGLNDMLGFTADPLKYYFRVSTGFKVNTQELAQSDAEVSLP